MGNHRPEGPIIMSNILSFVATPRKDQQRQVADQVSCEVVIFPGVRQERWDNTSDQQSQASLKH